MCQNVKNNLVGFEKNVFLQNKLIDMKRTLTIAFLIVFSVSGLWGQTPRVPPLDTILKCDTLVCPVAEEIELSTAEGIALLRWEGDTVMCSK